MRKSKPIESYKVIRTLLFFIVGIMPLVIFPVNGTLNTGVSKYLTMFIPITLFIFVYITHKNEIQIRYYDSEFKALLVYFSLMIFSALFSVAPLTSIFGSFARYDGILTFFFYFITYLIVRNSKIVGSWVFNVIVYSSLIVAFYGLSQYYGFNPIPKEMYRGDPLINPTFSTMGNQNFLGSYLVLVIPISLYLYFFKEKRIGLVAYGIQFLTLLCTKTRGAWIGAFFAFTFFLILHYYVYGKDKNFLKKIIYTVIASITIITLYTITSGDAFFTRLFSIFIDFSKLLKKDEDANLSGSFRIYIWQKVIELIKMRPIFGFGVETLGIVMDKFFKSQNFRVFGEYIIVDKAHNEYLNIAVSSGIPSLLAYLSFIYFELKKAFHRLKEDPAYVALLSAIIGYLIQAMFNIQSITVYYLFFVFLGLISSNTAIAYEKSESNFDAEVAL